MSPDPVLAAIDATLEAVQPLTCACGCERALGPKSKSMYYAGEACQHRWASRRGKPLTAVGPGWVSPPGVRYDICGLPDGAVDLGDGSFWQPGSVTTPGCYAAANHLACPEETEAVVKAFVSWAADSTMQPETVIEAPPGGRLAWHMSKRGRVGLCGGRAGWVRELDAAGNRVAIHIYSEMITLKVEYPS